MPISTYKKGHVSQSVKAFSLLLFFLVSLSITLQVEATAQDDARAFRFIENIGQWEDETLLLGTNHDALVRFREGGVDWWYPVQDSRSGDEGGFRLTTEFVGASKKTKVVGEKPAGATWNYYLGAHSNQQFSGARDYRRVRYHQLYPSIDALFYGREAKREMKYDFIVYPGGNPEEIVLRYDGADEVRITKQGDLEVVTRFGIVREAPPYSYQEIGGERIEVEAKFRKIDQHSYGFTVGSYNPEQTLIIDPCLAIEYLTFFGGGGFDEVTAMAVDSSGNGYAVGFSRATNFPTVPSIGELDPDNRVFVSKIAPDGSSLIYSSVFGPEYLGVYDQLRDPFSGTLILSLYEALGEDVEVTPEGRAVVAMTTNTRDLTTTPRAYQRNRADNRNGSICGPPFGNNFDLYVFRLSPSGTLEWSTYLGGGDDDYVRDIALDPSGNVALTGITHAAECGAGKDTLTFPVTLPPDRFSTSDSLRGFETFVTLLDQNGENLLFSAYYGGAGDEFASQIATGTSGDLYLLGSTNSTDLRTTSGAFEERPKNGIGGNVFDLYLARIDPSTESLLYSTYVSDNGGVGREGLGYGNFVARRQPPSPAFSLGGLVPEGAYQGLLLEQDGVVVLGGTTRSTTLPTTGGVLQGRNNNPGGDDSSRADAFLIRFDMNANRIVNATYLGGSGFDALGGIARDNDGNIVVGISTSSTNFPITRVNVQDRLQGNADAALTLLSPGFNGLEFSTYVGGKASSGARLWEQSVTGVTAGSDGSVYIYGGTVSWDLPLTQNPLKNSNDYHGGWIAKFVASLIPRIGTSLSLDFPPEVCDEVRLQGQLIFNSGQTPLQIDSLLFANGRFYRVVGAPSTPFTLGPCDSITIMVAFDPTADTFDCNGADLQRDTLRIISSNASPGEVRVPITATRSCVSFRFLLGKNIDDPRYQLGSRRGYNMVVRAGGEVQQRVTIEPAPENSGDISLRSPWQDLRINPGTASIDFNVNATDTGRYCAKFYLTIEPCGRRDTVEICTYVRSGFFNILPDTLDLGLVSCREQLIPTFIWNSGNDTLRYQLVFTGGEQWPDLTYDIPWDEARFLAPGDTLFYTTIYQPRGVGKREAIPVFNTNELLDSIPRQVIRSELDTVIFQLNLENLVGAFDDVLSLPIQYEPVRDGRAPTTEFTFLAQYDPNTLALEEIERSGRLTDGWEVAESRLTSEGRLIKLVMGSGGQPLTGSGVLANLRMRVLRGDTIGSPLDLSLEGVSQYCLTALIDTGFTFSLTAECLAHERLVFSGNRMLKPIYPNPVRGDLRIPFRMPVEGNVRIVLYDATGGLATVLLDQYMGEGNNELLLDSRIIPPGLYYCRMVVNDVLTDVREVVIAR